MIQLDPSLSLQAAMVARIKADARLADLGLGQRVFDHIPQNTPFPYVKIGEDLVTPLDHFCGSSSEVISTVRVYSRKPGRVECKRFAERLRFLLTKSGGLTVDGFRVVLGYCEGYSIEQHSDGLTHQAIIEFSYRLEPKEKLATGRSIIAAPILSAAGKLRLAASAAIAITPRLSAAGKARLLASAAIVLPGIVSSASATIFSPDRLFAASEIGAVYDPSDVTSLYGARDGRESFRNEPRVNLFSETENFTNLVWTKTGATVGLGVLRATAGPGNHRFSRAMGLSVPFVVFADASAGTSQFLQIYDGSSTNNFANFDLIAGAVATVGANATASMIPLGGGVYRCIVTYGTANAPNGNTFFGIADSGAAAWGAAFNATGSETINILRVQLQTGYIAGAYQFVGPTYDYIGSPVAIMLDKSRMGGKTAAQFIADQPELLPPGAGDGTSLTGWSIQGTGGVMSLVGGRIRIENGAAAEGVMRRSFTVEAGKNYLITINKHIGTDTNRGVIRLGAGANAGVFITTGTAFSMTTGDGIYRAIFLATSNATLFLDIGTNSATLGVFMEFNGLSIKEIPGYHYISPSNAARATYRKSARPSDGTELIVDGQFSAGVSNWTPIIATVSAESGGMRIMHSTTQNGGRARYNTAIIKPNRSYLVRLNVVQYFGDCNLIRVTIGDVNANAVATRPQWAEQALGTNNRAGAGFHEFFIEATPGPLDPSALGFIGIYAGNGTQAGGGGLLVDNVSVVELPESATLLHYLAPDGVDDWGQVLPVCDLGETWTHVGGWNATAATRAWATTSAPYQSGVWYAGTPPRLGWTQPNGSWFGAGAGVNGNIPHVATLERAANETIEIRQNGTDPASGSHFSNSGHTRGLALFSGDNNALNLPFAGRFYGGTWINRALTTPERAALERWQSIRTLDA